MLVNDVMSHMLTHVCEVLSFISDLYTQKNAGLF